MEIEKSALKETKALMDIRCTEKNIIEMLSLKLSEMLNEDFSSVVNVLYRIDVNEQKAQKCFGQSTDKIAECLAQLIWNRQIQKAEFRKKYSSE